MSPTIFKLSLVDIGFLGIPSIHSSALFLVLPELPDVIVSIEKVEFSLGLDIPRVETPVNYLLSVAEVADAFAMRHPCPFLAHIDHLIIFDECGLHECGLMVEYNWTFGFDHQQLFELSFKYFQFPLDVGVLIFDVIQKVLHFLHFSSHFILDHLSILVIDE